MDSGSLDVNKSHGDTLQDDFHGRGEFQGKMIVCPNCMEKPFSFEREPAYVADLDMPEPEDVELERESDLAEAEDVEIEVDEEPFETEKEAPQDEEPLLELPEVTLPTEEEIGVVEPTAMEAPQDEEPLLELPEVTLPTDVRIARGDSPDRGRDRRRGADGHGGPRRSRDQGDGGGFRA